MPGSGRKANRTVLIGAKVEPEIASLVEQVAQEETRTKSTYVYRLVLEDLQRRGLITSSSVNETGTGYKTEVNLPGKAKRSGT